MQLEATTSIYDIFHIKTAYLADYRLKFNFQYIKAYEFLFLRVNIIGNQYIPFKVILSSFVCCLYLKTDWFWF